MKTLNKKQKNKQSGFAMLEVMLAVIIIAIASLGIYRLYSSSSDSSRLSSTEQIVTEISNAVSRYSLTTLSAPADLTTLQKAGYLSSDVPIAADKKTVTTQLGAFAFTNDGFAQSNTSAFQLTTSTIQKSMVFGFVTDMCQLGDISIGSTAAQPVDCSNISNDTSVKDYTNGSMITIVIPKGSVRAQ